MYFDSTYLTFIIPALIVTVIAQMRVSRAFKMYSQIRNSAGITGAVAAERVLMSHGVTNVRIERTSGKLSDHFDPRSNVIRLSESVYGSTSVAAVGVAAHEAGHAVQHANNYAPGKIRSAIVPAVNIGSNLGWILILIGIILPTYGYFLTIGIALYSLTVLFTLVTLPVEFDASRRALETIKNESMLTDNERDGAKKVLSAAAMTYVAAAFAAIMNLLRLITIANRRR